MAAIQPGGVGTEMPRPLSSHTSSSGMRMPCRALQLAALIAPVAVEWLAEASPKLATDERVVRPAQRRAEPRRLRLLPAERPADAEGPRQVAAIVEVCGITARSGWPNTLCRPPAIGSSADARQPERHVEQPAPGGRPACVLRAR